MTDQEAEILYTKNEPLVIAFMTKYFPTYVADEDCLQTVRLGLWKACRCFDPDRGMKLSTLAYVVMRNTLLKYLDKMRRPKKNGVLIVSMEERLEKSAEYGDNDDFADERDFTDEIAEKIDVEVMLSKLTKAERITIIGTILDGKSYAQIAEEIHESKTEVRRHLNEGMEKLRRTRQIDE